MSKARPLSIYLLKEGFNVQNALKESHELQGPILANNLPQNATLYLSNHNVTEPWWKPYFGINQNLPQTSNGALIFLPVNNRCFVLSFGHVYFNLKDISYEHDFGLRVTLNSVDPKKLKSTDTLEPSEARRKTIQIPTESDLTYFDFDRDSNIIKRLTGKVKDEYKDIFVQATGASSLRISSKVPSADLPVICEKLISLYESEQYKNTFPGIGNVEPVKDPQIIEQLNDKLLLALKNKDESLALTVPDIINYEVNAYSCFSGCGQKELYPDVLLENYYQHLMKNNFTLSNLTIFDIKQQKLAMTDQNGTIQEDYSIFSCLVFDTHLNSSTECYNLCDGHWYKVEEDYAKKLHQTLDQYYEELDLPDYNHTTEGAYNKAVTEFNTQYICLDQEDIKPPGQTEIEPCDLYLANNGIAVLIHIKISTLSEKLSHLFNQGVNSIRLIKSEATSKEKLKALIKAKIGSNPENEYIEPIEASKYKVIYAIVSRKDKSKKSLNLPLFSRISLMRCIKELSIINDVKPSFCFINNITQRKPPKPKGKKKKP